MSLAFVGVLSVAIVLIINNTVAAYQRGLTLGHVNTLGTDLVEDMRTAVTGASTRSASAECATYYPAGTVYNQCVTDGGYDFVMVTSAMAGAEVKVELGDEILEDLPVWGAVCTGAYSYIWNSGYFFAEGVEVSGTQKASLKYKLNGIVTTTEDFKLLKVQDNRRAVCATAVLSDEDYGVQGFNGMFDISEGFPGLVEAPEELVAATDYNELAIYDLAVARPVEGTAKSGALYAVSFILGTVRGGINVQSTGQTCEAPNSANAIGYCAINQFSFVAQTGGGA